MIRSLSMAICLTVALAGATTRAAEDPREREGRALFAKSEYQRALDLFATLFAEKGDPVYLRNIGRCRQMMRQPDEAIDAFREYLRKSPRLRRTEREEVQGFIADMQKLKAEQASESPAPHEPAPDRSEPPAAQEAEASPSARPEASAPALAPNPEAPAPAASLLAKPAAEPSAEESSSSITHRWWFWTGIGAVIVGGAVTAFLLLDKTSRMPCPQGFTCP
jgi:tetratricopeptide (TPR) repeat protein